MNTQGSRQKNFWRTLPGIITSTAGIITAITGLIIALSQIGLFNKSDEEGKMANNISAETFKTSEPPKTTLAVEKKSAPPTASKLEAQFSMTSIKVNKELQYQILEAVVEPKDPQNSILTIKIRCSNDGPYGFNFWSASFKLDIDDLPTAPLGYYDLNELVDSHTAKDGTIAFELPNNAKSLKFLIYEGNNKIEIPVSLTKS